MTVACRLPDGRLVSLAPEIADRIACGVIVVQDVAVGPGDAVHAAIAPLGVQLRQRYADREPSRIPGLAEARRLYKSFGEDPSRHRPSSEALLRRILQGKGLYRISNVVDACNLASLTFLLPIGMYDLARVEGDVCLRLGGPGDEYQGIRKGMVHLTGRLALYDERGPFGSPTSDSARTCTGDTTRTILAVIMATAAYDKEAMTAHLAHFGELFARFCRARTAFARVLRAAAA